MWDPKDITKLVAEINKVDAELPCNVWGLLKNLMQRIEVLEVKMLAMEK